MHILRVEHPVADFNAWKQAFDNDPAGRQESGVMGYRISRAIEDQRFVSVDLEFETAATADAFLVKLRGVWGRVTGTLVETPQGRLLEVIEAKDY